MFGKQGHINLAILRVERVQVFQNALHNRWREAKGWCRFEAFCKKEKNTIYVMFEEYKILGRYSQHSKIQKNCEAKYSLNIYF